MIFFNSSMPRSGSELLQVILHQNSAIYASSTSPLLEYQFGARTNYDLPEVLSQDPQVMQSAFVSMCGGMAKAYYGAITDRLNICDKNRGWMHYYEWVEQWNPNPKMICMVRDMRSVFASMEKIYRANRHRPCGPDNPAALENMTVIDRVNHWANSTPIGLSARRLQDAFQRGISDRILFVRYEDLCNNPEESLNEIYGYLGIKPFTHNFKDLKKEVAEDDSYFGVYGQHTVHSEIVPSNPHQWKTVFDESIGAYIYNQYDWFNKAFSY